MLLGKRRGGERINVLELWLNIIINTLLELNKILDIKPAKSECMGEWMN